MNEYRQAVIFQRRPGRQAVDGSLDRTELVRMATLAASSHNTQPWRFRLEDGTMAIVPDFTRRCPVVDENDAHLFKSLGCAAENLVHAAAAQGHAAHIVFDDAKAELRVDLERSPSVVAGDLFHAIPRRQCTRLAYDERDVGHQARDLLEQAGRGQGVRVILIDKGPVHTAIRELVRQGNKTQLADTHFRKELISWLRFNDASALATGDGLFGRTSGHPALPDWIARSLTGLILSAERQARTDEEHLRGSPLIAVFTAAGGGPAAWVEAGRACQRFTLQATTLDIRTAFINQPIEVPELLAPLADQLGLSKETALLMLRIGFGPLAPYSLRRPVKDVIMAGTA